MKFPRYFNKNIIKNYFRRWYAKTAKILRNPTNAKLCKNEKKINFSHNFVKAFLIFLKPRTHERAKCTYVWMGLRTCTLPSANVLHTVCHESKFVGVLHEHKENWMRRVSFPSTRCPLFASGSRKIN